MKWEKTVKDAALGTLAAVAVLFALMLITLHVLFPVTMMNITYNLGLDKSSLRFAKRAYKQTKDIYCVAFALEVAIGLDDETEIIWCGDKLSAAKEFESYCAKRNAQLPEDVLTPYELYVYGQVCTAMYETGERTDAIERACSYTTGFPRNNPLAVLAICALTADEKDENAIHLIKEKIQEMEEEISEADKAYYDDIIKLIE